MAPPERLAVVYGVKVDAKQVPHVGGDPDGGLEQ